MKVTDFGLIVRKLRLELNLRMKDMATALDVSSAYLSAVELGNRQLTPQLCARTYGYFEAMLEPWQRQTLRASLEDLLTRRVVQDFREACDACHSAALMSSIQIPKEAACHA
jgi:transcriptional regulator with XRE-family HTH domain